MKDFHQQFVLNTDETVYSNVVDFSALELAPAIEAMLDVSTYVAGSVAVVLQVSKDKDDANSWVDLATVDSLYSNPAAYSSTGKRILRSANGYCYYRFKITTASSADLTLDIQVYPATVDFRGTPLAAHTQTPTRTSVSASTVTTVATANLDRKAGALRVESTNVLAQKVYVRLGSGASATNYDEILEAGDLLTLDLDERGRPYNGAITVFTTDTAVVNFTQR